MKTLVTTRDVTEYLIWEGTDNGFRINNKFFHSSIMEVTFTRESTTHAHTEKCTEIS